MAQNPTFFLPLLEIDQCASGSVIERNAISPEVIQHLKSRRISRGEQIEFLNGRGLKVVCQCEDALSHRFRVQVSEQEKPLSPRIELFLALPKGESFGESIAQATEIGVSRIHFIKSDHAQIPKELLKLPIERAQRIADASCEQCARSWRMTFSDKLLSLDEALMTGQGLFQNIIADEALSSSGHIGFMSPQKFAPESTLRLFIGPEGGWSERERQSFGDFVLRLGLGSLVLRVPTAIVAASFYLRQCVSEET